VLEVGCQTTTAWNTRVASCAYLYLGESRNGEASLQPRTINYIKANLINLIIRFKLPYIYIYLLVYPYPPVVVACTLYRCYPTVTHTSFPSPHTYATSLYHPQPQHSQGPFLCPDSRRLNTTVSPHLISQQRCNRSNVHPLSPRTESKASSQLLAAV
jgi:hypothetical protein